MKTRARVDIDLFVIKISSGFHHLEVGLFILKETKTSLYGLVKGSLCVYRGVNFGFIQLEMEVFLLHLCCLCLLLLMLMQHMFPHLVLLLKGELGTLAQQVFIASPVVTGFPSWPQMRPLCPSNCSIFFILPSRRRPHLSFCFVCCCAVAGLFSWRPLWVVFSQIHRLSPASKEAVRLSSSTTIFTAAFVAPETITTAYLASTRA